MRAVPEELESRRAEARSGGGVERIEVQHARGRLRARERLQVLLDEESFEAYDLFVEHRCVDFGMGRNNYARPTAEIAVMGVKGAVEIIFRKDMADKAKIAAHTETYEKRFCHLCRS